jgi:RNA polymerase sigma-70 factor (ECF subfamily)
MSEHGVDIDEVWRGNRPYLVDLAYRMLGNIQDAEDVVQEAFTRLLRVDVDTLDEIRGWLVVVVSRLCIDHLRSATSRNSRGSASFDDERLPPMHPVDADPADRVTLDDSIRMAMLVVLEQLSPPERAVFVLHDVFRFPFDQVAEIVGRTPAASRQIASRARRRIEAETGSGRFQVETDEQHQIAEGFIAACAGGDLEGLMRLLDPDVVGQVELLPGRRERRPLRGDLIVARGALGFFGPAMGLTLVSHPINGQPGVMAFRDQQLAGILVFKVRDGRIHDIHGVADPGKFGYASVRTTDSDR